MPGAILIAVSDGYGGYGDFLFVLKLAAQIKKYYADLLGEDNVPEIKLISQDSGQKKIRSLKGDTEFGVEVLTPEELKRKVDDKELEVASIIEGPVFQSRLITRINNAIQNQSRPVPLVMMPEYAYSGASHRRMIEDQRQFRKQNLNKIVYQETIYTGYNSKAEEKGIILSDNLITPEEPSLLSSKLDEKIKSALLGEKDIETYQTNTDMYFQYSHDTYPTIPETSPAERFLNMHRIYAKDSKKNQDVLMVGKTESTKRAALKKVKKQLIKDGFTKISFYNAETKKEEYLHGGPETEGRHYRVVYTSGMSHPSMIAAQALSGDLVGATGDQSFGEAVSGDKILVYECLSHKQLLRNEYYNQLKKLDPKCTEVLDLLKNAERESDYRRMEALLTKDMKVRLKNLSKSFRESGELAKFAAIAAMPAELLSKQIISGATPPYTSDSHSMSSFERTLMVGNFDAVPYVTQHCSSKSDERQQFCEILTKKNNEGKSYLSVLRSAKPDAPETSRASYLVTRFNTEKYKAPRDSKRETMFNAYKELISTFSTLGLGRHDEDALIGLMLLTTKNIANEYSFLSPRKGFFFGSRFYSNLEDTLKELGVNLKTITPQERQRYYSALTRVMENNPNLIANEYILNSLSKEANITMPKIPPLLTNSKAEALLRSKNLDGSDPTIFRTKTALYKTHSVPLGQGGWGSVYAARHYAHSEGGIKVSPPLAIKMMPARNQLAMDKEARMFNQAYPEGHFERFNKNETAYLAMPLFPGTPLDKYLMDHLELPRTTRQEMATSLLENLSYIHKNNVIHNDIKPKNVLYDPVAKKIHIVDFGCAEEVGTRIQFRDINTAKFAIEYMPPEYLQDANLTNKTDVYSLTLSLAEILGANKHDLVKNRMERALAKINEPVKTSIRKTFNSTGSLDEAMFTREVSKHWNNSEFKKFIKEFVNDKYDFSPYTEILGKDAIELLNNMQNTNPDERPSIEDALEILNRKEERLEISL
jgi:hypothetical protein